MQNLIKKSLNFKMNSLTAICRLVKLGGGKRYRQIRKLRLAVGSILIEFAFALPVFLVLLYYVHDLPKQKLLHRKMQFVAYELAAIVQNIAKQKSTTDSPLLTKRDLGKAMALAGLSIFPGNTLWPEAWYKSKTGYVIHSIWHYVEATGNNRGQQKWSLSFLTTSVYNTSGDISTNQSHDTTIVPWSTNEMTASLIYPELVLDKVDKIILEVELFYDYLGRWEWKFPNGVSTKDVSPREVFGFLLMNPNGKGSNKSAFFPAIVIFAPVVGAFSKTAVPQ